MGLISNIKGSTGTTGNGVPVGGTTAQILEKIDSTNYNTRWSDRAWIVKSKAANQTVTNSATLVNDDTLFFPLSVSGKYRFRMRIFFDTTAAGDFKYSFSGPAVALYRCTRAHLIPSGATPNTFFDTAFPVAVSVVGTGTIGGYIDIQGVITNGASPGNLQFSFAQNAATVDTGAIVLAGSFIEYQTV